MADVKQLVIEYILTNGTLPEFQERLELSKPFWKTATEPFIVYRGQGHEKAAFEKPQNTNKTNIKNAARPVISTSKNINSVLEFTDKQGCCIFEITVDPGIQFLDFTEITDITENDIAVFMAVKKQLDPEDKIWPFAHLPLRVLLSILNTRKVKEEEVLLNGLQGTFKTIGEASHQPFTFVTNETKRKKIKDYKTVLIRVIKKSYAPKIGGSRINQKSQKTRKRDRKGSQRSKTLQRKSK
jgi:hypothetical protein